MTDGASNLDELAVQLQGLMLRRSKDDVLELPPKLRTWLSIEVPPTTAAKERGAVVQLLLERQRGAAPRQRSGDAAIRGRLLALLSTARLKLAAAKTSQTIEFVENAVEQGEKVIVFSCFDEPVKKFREHFGDAALQLNGAMPTAKRQELVDRFQNDDTVRVFVANIVAGGVGLIPTAARHVVFNDLDWVPANHWQAEDRAYRIGQTNTVHVTYLVAGQTVDDFVRTVLTAKAALVGAVTEGRALDQLAGNVLEKLERLLGAISPRLADLKLAELDEADVARVLRETVDAAERERNAARNGDHVVANASEKVSCGASPGSGDRPGADELCGREPPGHGTRAHSGSGQPPSDVARPGPREPVPSEGLLRGSRRRRVGSMRARRSWCRDPDEKVGTAVEAELQFRS